MKAAVASVLAAGVLAACSTAGPMAAPSPTLAGGYGAMPYDYRAAAETYFETQFTESRGAHVRFDGEPYRATARINGREWSGWATDVKVRAQLPSGRYTGYRPYTVVFQDGVAVALSQDASYFARAGGERPFAVTSR